MIGYVDTSELVTWLLREPGWSERWTRLDRAIASDLLRIELFRTVDRLRLTGKLDESELIETLTTARRALAKLELYPLDGPILDRAADAFPMVVATLDAIHLSTALLWIKENQQPLAFLTLDRQLAAAALACGLDARAR